MTKGLQLILTRAQFCVPYIEYDVQPYFDSGYAERISAVF